MKATLITLTLLFSTQTFATSYCYDYGLSALVNVEQSLLACEGRAGMNATVPAVDKVSKRLLARLPFFYKKRALKALGELDAIIEGQPNNDCTEKLRQTYETRYRRKIAQAIDWCSP